MIDNAMVADVLRAVTGRRVALISVILALVAAGGGAQAQSYTCTATLAAGSLTSSCNAQLTDASEHLEGTHPVRKYIVKGSCMVKGWQHCSTYNDTKNYPHKEWNQEFSKVFLFDSATLTWDDFSHTARVVGNPGPGEAYSVYLLGSKSGPYVDAEFKCALDPFVSPGAGCKPLSAMSQKLPHSYYSGGNCPPGGEAVCPPFAGLVKQPDAQAMIKKNKDKYTATQPNWNVASTLPSNVPVHVGAPAKASPATPVVPQFGFFDLGAPKQGDLFAGDAKTIKFAVLMNASSIGAVQDKKLELRLQKWQGAHKLVAPNFSVTSFSGAGAGLASGEALVALAELQPQGTWTAQVCFSKPSPFAAPLCTKEVMFHVGKSDLPSKFPLAETPAGAQSPGSAQAKLPAFGAVDSGPGRSSGATGAPSPGGARAAAGGAPVSSALPAVQAPVVRQRQVPVTRSTDNAGTPTSGAAVPTRSADGRPSDAEPTRPALPPSGR
ncbi:MAG: hypothetical protein IT518_16530 [Burkholderiales bacterium]|nr:hypothetical protein [Burkholderiales bacterium]